MKKSRQIGSRIPPEKGEDILALILMCTKCDTQRSFRVNDSFMLTINRLASGCQYDVSCETCGHEVSVKLVWTKRHRGWTVERVTFSDGIAVEDENPMRKTEGEKQI
jgi:hypothetical protein